MSSIAKKILLTFIACQMLFLGLAQEIRDGMVTYNYSREDGLSHNQVLFSMQDSKGYMWFGTGGGGACRFDGANFKIYDISTGLHDNEIYQLFEDTEGKIWFGASNLRLSYLENGIVKSYEYNHLITESVKKVAHLKRMHIDPHGTLYLFFHNHNSIVISKDGQELSEDTKEGSAEIYQFKNGDVKFSKHTFPILTNASNLIQKINFLSIDKTNTPADTNYRQVEFHINHPAKFFKRWVPFKTSDNIFICTPNEIKRFDHKFNLIGEALWYDDIGKYNIVNIGQYDDKIWLLTQHEGVLVGKMSNNEFLIEKKLFQNNFITTMTVDESGGLWLTSHSEGVYHIPYPKNEVIPKTKNGQVNRKNLAVIDDNFIVYSASPNVLSFKRNDKVDALIIGSEDEYISDIVLNQSKDTLFILGTYPFLMVDSKKGTLIKNQKKEKKKLNTSISGISLKNLLAVGGNILGVYKNNAWTEYKSHLFSIRCVLVKDGKTVLGTSAGFFAASYEEDSISMVNNNRDRLEPLLNSYVSDLESYKNGLWIASKGIGIGYYTDSLEFKITEADGLSSSHFTDIKQDADTLWVSTLNGLNKITLNSDLKIENITVFNNNNGLSSNQIYGVEVSAKYIYISTKKGIDIVPRNQLAGKLEQISLEILGLYESSELKIPLSEKEELSYKKNDLCVKVNAIQFNSAGKHQFRYRLLPQETIWKSSEQGLFEYNNLTPNDYTFEVEIKNNHGNWVSHNELNFKLIPPFWKQTWFICLMAISLLALVIFILRRREAAYRKKIFIENQINKLHGKALRAQVNPHFIFNTLNAIQRFMLQEDFQSSNKFITDFSKLVRMILHHSDKETVLLSEEIDMIETYLSLEQMRHMNSFKYKIKTNKLVALNTIRIAPMLIQPYLENAIWHGLADQSKNGLIQVSFEITTNQFVQCTITDNGIGRQAAEKNKTKLSKPRKSIGMSLSSDRLKALNTNAKITIQDLYSEQGTPKGTKVIIFIPINNE